jgi:micrococcal nuclease
VFPVKTPRAQTPGVFFRLLKQAAILSFGLCCAAAWAECPAARTDEVVKIKQVSDGDTVRLADGRRVRIIGINAPEIEGKHRRAESQAKVATRAAAAFFTDGRIWLEFDAQRTDRYGRLLAHAYNNKGQSLAVHLLERGLAFHIGVPPNLTHADCLARQEQLARDQLKGIWRDPFWAGRSAASLTLRDTGFKRVKGRVVDISGRKDIWIELDGALVLKITAADKRYFKADSWQQWQGKQVEVVGWITNRSQSIAVKQGHKPLVLQVRTPYAIRVVEN